MKWQVELMFVFALVAGGAQGQEVEANLKRCWAHAVVGSGERELGPHARV